MPLLPDAYTFSYPKEADKAPGSGHILGYLHCSHAHCQHRNSRNVLAGFSRDELTQAKRAAELADRSQPVNDDPRRPFLGARYLAREVTHG